jgi:nitroreductase
MNVSEAMNARMSVRAFLDKPVPRQVVEDILLAAGRAPSGGNLQPWRVWALANDEMVRFKALVAGRQKVQPKGEGTEYNIYPPDLTEPYVARRFKNGEDLYRALRIAREDRPQRQKQFARNFEFFGAPVGLIFVIERQMGSAQWTDLGMYMQSIMLLAVERGLGTCSQEAWALWHKTIREFLELPDNLMVFCGMALGYPELNHPVNSLRTDRAEPSEYISMRGFC